MKYKDLPEDVVEIIRLAQAGCREAERLTSHHYSMYCGNYLSEGKTMDEAVLTRFARENPDFPWIPDSELEI